MGAGKVYWTTKDGRKLDVDSMDEQHVRNVLKMLLRQMNEATVKKPVEKRIGNIERQFLERQLQEEIDYLEDLYGFN